ncbi:hypothetical protein [Mycobacteroides abscessus]|uniref:hypothetical protein n=1 Tax=Mycobacteroides abscessus TaxID=36809 RepID=UPI001055E7F1|nr:hypothetical protein [Mycobacteroides abscessus]
MVDPEIGAVEPRVLNALLGSNIDGLEGRKLLSEEFESEYSDAWSDAYQWLLRQVVYLERRHAVQTCRGVSTDNPWYPTYLTLFGDLPDQPDRERNERNNLASNLVFADVVDIGEVEDEPSIRDILAKMANMQRISVIELTRMRLPTNLVGSYNKGVPETSRFGWGRSKTLAQYGPNVLVIHRPDSTDDLALAWNLRARFAHPIGLPLALPLTESTADDIRFVARTDQAQHFFGSGHNLAVTSFSVTSAELQELCKGTGFTVRDPYEFVGEVYGCGVASTEMAQFVDGKATVPCFTPTDIETLGQRFLGSSNATWLTLTATVSEHRLPPSRTMRRDGRQNPGYLHGSVVHVGKLDSFATLRQPAGLEVLRALALDRSLRARVSTPGKAAENLIRAAAGDLSMFATPAIAMLFVRLARRGHASLVKRRLNQFLDGSDVIAGTDKYDVLMDRLDQALGAPDVDEIGHLNINQIREVFGLGGKSLPLKETAAWVDWAVRRRLILRGVQATCPICKHTQWRPLGDAVPELQCHGCGQFIDSPFGAQKIDYQYRASEVLLKAVEHDVLPHVLAMRYLGRALGQQSVFGAYPGLELLEVGEKDVVAEFDAVVVLANGHWVVGECKSRQRGLTDSELVKLWAAADRVGAVATFTATLDEGSDCGDLWRRTEDPRGRPHFALCAGHLYDLPAGPVLYGEDPFGWREGLVVVPPDVQTSQEDYVRKRFGDYLLRRSHDPSKRRRAPWDHHDEGC